MIEELYLLARLADLEREFAAHDRQRRLLARLHSPVATRPFVSAAVLVTHPWGEPGHEFIGRRRAWLHNLLAADGRNGASASGEG